MRRKSSAALFVIAATTLGACSAPTSPTTLSVTLTSAPATITASPSTGVTYTIVGDATHPDQIVEYPWVTSFTVNMQETGGLAVDITAVSLVVHQASGGIVIAPSGGAIEHYQFNSTASGNHLNAHGTASVSFQVWYDLPNKGREALVTVSFSFKDANNNTYSQSIDVKIAP